MGLNQIASICFLLFLHISVCASVPPSILQIFPKIQGSSQHGNPYYCDSWRLTVETNNAGYWGSVIPGECENYVWEYVTGAHYLSDLEAVANCSLAFAKTANVSKDGKDAWVFDVDETLLSNVAYFLPSKSLDEQSFDLPADFSPAIESSLRLYNVVKKLGFKIFLLTGRDEKIRALTTANLHFVGYHKWERLIMRGPDDEGTLAWVYKSKKRTELTHEGYRIRGNSGDQWSDLLGYAISERSFKLPNPMYYAA